MPAGRTANIFAARETGGLVIFRRRRKCAVSTCSARREGAAVRGGAPRGRAYRLGRGGGSGLRAGVQGAPGAVSGGRRGASAAGGPFLGTGQSGRRTWAGAHGRGHVLLSTGCNEKRHRRRSRHRGGGSQGHPVGQQALRTRLGLGMGAGHGATDRGEAYRRVVAELPSVPALGYPVGGNFRAPGGGRP